MVFALGRTGSLLLGGEHAQRDGDEEGQQLGVEVCRDYCTGSRARSAFADWRILTGTAKLIVGGVHYWIGGALVVGRCWSTSGAFLDHESAGYD